MSLPRPGSDGRTGAVWSAAGAEAVLRLRALRTSGDFDDSGNSTLRRSTNARTDHATSPATSPARFRPSDHTSSSSVGWPRDFSPGAPTEPDMQISSIRLFGAWGSLLTVDAMHDARIGKRIPAAEQLEPFPGHMPTTRAAVKPRTPDTCHLV